MRKRIDYLLLINLLLLSTILVVYWIQNKYLALLGIAATIFATLYEINLARKIPHRVEKTARPRLLKRVVISLLQTIIMIGIFTSFYLR